MKASPLAVFLAILTALFVVLPGILAFFPFRGSLDYFPSGSFTHAQKASNTTENVFFSDITPAARPSEIMIAIESFNWEARYRIPSNQLSGPYILDNTPGASYSNNITGMVYTDILQDGKVSNGDYITITLSHEGLGSEVYRVLMWHYAFGDLMDIFFTW
jgi:hypothetical protein